MSGRFIVTTGRCGSTLLSQLLREHPAVLSLSEFFAVLQSPALPAFPEGPMTGEEFWGLLSTPRQEMGAVWQKLCAGPQDHPSPRRRFETPPLLIAALPLLTADAAALYAELGRYVRARPPAGAGTHYSGVFGWLCQRLDRAVWVERSGGSTWFLPDLLRCWPEGRYLHLVRDGRDVAISMSRRPGFRLAVLMADLEQENGHRRGGDMADAVRNLTSADQVPLERFGEIWARQVLAAEERLRSLRRDQALLMRYEDLAADPGRELQRLAEFFELGAETAAGWIRWAARQVERRQPSWPLLPGADRGRLEAACRPGLRLLRYQ